MIYILSYILENKKNYYMILNIINNIWNIIKVKSIDWVEVNISIKKTELEELVEKSNKYLIIDEEITEKQIKKMFRLLLIQKIRLDNKEAIISMISDGSKVNNSFNEKEIENTVNNTKISEDPKYLEKLFKPCSPRLRWVLLKVFYELNL